MQSNSKTQAHLHFQYCCKPINPTKPFPENKWAHVCVCVCVWEIDGGRNIGRAERVSGWRICSSCSLMSQLVIFIWPSNEAKVNKVQHPWVELLLRHTAKWTGRSRQESKRHKGHDTERTWQFISNLIMYRPAVSSHKHTHTHFTHASIRLHWHFPEIERAHLLHCQWAWRLQRKQDRWTDQCDCLNVSKLMQWIEEGQRL